MINRYLTWYIKFLEQGLLQGQQDTEDPRDLYRSIKLQNFKRSFGARVTKRPETPANFELMRVRGGRATRIGTRVTKRGIHQILEKYYDNYDGPSGSLPNLPKLPKRDFRQMQNALDESNDNNEVPFDALSNLPYGRAYQTRVAIRYPIGESFFPTITLGDADSDDDIDNEEESGDRVSKKANFGARVTKKNNFGARVTKRGNFGARVTKKANFGARVTKKSDEGSQNPQKIYWGTRLLKRPEFGTRVTKRNFTTILAKRPVFSTRVTKKR